MGKIWISREPHIVSIPTYVEPRNLNNDLQEWLNKESNLARQAIYFLLVRDFTNKEKLRRYFAEG